MSNQEDTFPEMRPAVHITDQDVYYMVLSHHRPEELWTHHLSGSIIDSVICGHCRQDWPCATKNNIEKWKQAHYGQTLEF